MAGETEDTVPAGNSEDHDKHGIHVNWWLRQLARARGHARRFRQNDQLTLSVIAVIVGVTAGYAALAFRWLIGMLQTISFGCPEDSYVPGEAMACVFGFHATWWQVLFVPAVGGLIVGLVVKFFMPGNRPQGVADVIEASAHHGGRIQLRTGLVSAAISVGSIGAGASVGREGPVVHLGATLAHSIARRLHLGRMQQQTLLGCGVAAAIAASFNAPIAGVLFALEVVIGHYALSAFAPVVIASVMGTIVTRVYFGNLAAFAVPEHPIVSFWQFPAFALLGILSGVVAIAFMRSCEFASNQVDRTELPVWIRPAIAGLLVGAIALAFPQVLGVGYGITSDALMEKVELWLLIALLFAKTAATVISLSGGFGGGVFSPSLVIGAMLGGSFGIIATQVFPDLSSGHGAYTLIGMGAVAGAVLGAPISTILIIFELTHDYKLTIAVMFAVVIASVITQQLHGKSFFSWQLERRGVSLRGGRELELLHAIHVSELMEREWDRVSPDASWQAVHDALLASKDGELFVINDDNRLVGTITSADLLAVEEAADGEITATAAEIARRKPPVLRADEDLSEAVEHIERIGEPHIAVVEDEDAMVMVGLAHERDLMLNHKRALLQARAEERGEA